MKLRSRIYELQLKHTFGISRSTRDVQRTLIIELEQGGKKGYGEVTESEYYHASLEKMQTRLEQLMPLIKDYQLADPEQFWDYLNRQLDNERFLHCAIDVAAHDLFGKLNNKPLYQIWGLKWKNIPLTNFTIGIDTIQKMEEKLKEQPWPLYKIKLGTDNDLQIIQSLRNCTTATFRVDANAAWTAEQTIKNAAKLADLGVEFIEQPMHPEAWAEMQMVKTKCALPLMADEACKTERDLDDCATSFDGINVKLMKAGGLTPARRMLLKARKLGLKTMVGCMTESSIGIAAIAQLLPYLDYVDMDGALLLKNDIAYGVNIEDGVIRKPKNPGTGSILIQEM
jgi:L-alanine-DL-glutamate epimerase-like enolase superfamily enzyme